MPSPSRYRVHFVDPIKPRRDATMERLRHGFQCEGFGSVGDALPAAGKEAPHAVVFNLRQVDGNGLTAAAAYRKAAGPEVLLVVLGVPDQATSPEQRQALQSRHQVDLWPSRTLEPEALEALLSHELRQRSVARDRKTAASAPTPARPAPAASAPPSPAAPAAAAPKATGFARLKELASMDVGEFFKKGARGAA